MRPELNGISIFNVVVQFSPCFAGLRTILSKLYLLQNYSNFIISLDAAIEPDLFFDIVLDSNLPKPLREVVSSFKCFRHFEHSQQATLERFGHRIEAFRNEISRELEIQICSMCGQFKKQSNLQNPRDGWLQYLANPAIENVKICQQCAPSLRNNRRPRLAVSF